MMVVFINRNALALTIQLAEAQELSALVATRFRAEKVM
jgi:hypothetical protein